MMFCKQAFSKQLEALQSYATFLSDQWKGNEGGQLISKRGGYICTSQNLRSANVFPYAALIDSMKLPQMAPK